MNLHKYLNMKGCFSAACLMALLCSQAGYCEDGARPTLRWMGHWKARGLRENLVLETLEEFQFLHQDADIVMSFPEEITGGRDKRSTGKYIAEMIRSGKIEWDVVWMDSSIYQTVAEELGDPDWGKKHLVDFSEFDDIKAAQKPFLVNGPDCHGGTGGVFVGPYIEGFYTYLWYNLSLAEKLGLEIKELNMTADDFLGYLQRLREYNRTAETPATGFVIFSWSASVQRLAYNLYLSEHLAHPDTPNEEIFIRILRFFEAMHSCDPLLYYDELLYRDDGRDSWRHSAQLLMEDKALFMVEPIWRYAPIEAEFPDLMKKLRPAQLPGFENQSFYVGGYINSWAVMKSSPARDLGIELMRFWCSPQIAQKWIRYTKSPTGLSSNLYDSEYGLDPFAQFHKIFILGKTPQTDIAFLKKETNPIRPIEEYLLPIMDGVMTADEAIIKMKNQPHD